MAGPRPRRPLGGAVQDGWDIIDPGVVLLRLGCLCLCALPIHGPSLDRRPAIREQERDRSVRRRAGLGPGRAIGGVLGGGLLTPPPGRFLGSAPLTGLLSRDLLPPSLY